jgi:parvulin-like peptidyl-prolyl isomerase
MKRLWLLIPLLVFFAAAGCDSKKDGKEGDASAKSAQSAKSAKSAEPEYISVQHILIAFDGTLPGKNITRSRESAQELAGKVFEMAKSGKDFDDLVKEFTDDSYPGVYKMANFGVPPDMSQQIYPRDRMVPAFGDVGFPLELGGIGMAAYDPEKSRYGWHIIKRVE